MITLDFSEVKGSNFEPMPEGKYLLKIEKVEQKTSKAGNPMLNMTFEVIEGEYEGRKVFDNYTLTQNALWKLQDLLVALDYSVDGTLDLSPDELEGRIFEGDVIIQESKGYDPQNRIKNHFAIDSDTIIL